MLAHLRNDPRDYAWGSTTLIAALQRRTPNGSPEAEIWFGDHPGSPAHLPDGTGLDTWLRAEGHPPLPYLLKLLAAASPLSIQVHPGRARAQRGFAAEEAAGIARDAPERNYRDDNHKPEVIVAVSDRFEALAGLRAPAETRALLAALPQTPGIAELDARLQGSDAAKSLRDTLAWALSGQAHGAVADIVTALTTGPEVPELSAVRRIAVTSPDDPGVVVALLMHHVVLARGEALYAPAGVLHAYLDGLGVELMAASDNVLRGGLTPKHIDIAELLDVVDAHPIDPPRIAATEVHPGVAVFRPEVDDFELWRIAVTDTAPASIAIHGPAIALAVDGEVRLEGGQGDIVTLAPGTAAFVTADEGVLHVRGAGELFVALPGQ